MLKKLLCDHRGIAHVIVAFIATICVAPLVWFPASYISTRVMELILGMYSFPYLYQIAIDFASECIALLCVFCLFSAVIWAWVNAHRSSMYG